MTHPVAAPTLVLASASPRRSEILAAAGVAFTVCPADIDERLPPDRTPEQAAEEIALAKARTVASAASGPGTVLAADTLVVLGTAVLGKPAGPADATAMLRRLRGRAHRVVTGVAVAGAHGTRTGHRVTHVSMREYSDAEIDAFVGSGVAADKAGAYAIQDEAFRPVARIEGCYCNVVGLPLGLTLRLLEECGYAPGPPVPLPQCAGCPDWQGRGGDGR